MNFLELAKTVLSRVQNPMTVNEIWDKAVELGLHEELNSKGKTPSATLGARLYIEIRDNAERSEFVPMGKRPIRFGLKNITKSDVAGIALPKEKNKGFDERALHPLLVKFADTFPHFRGAKLKTIYHENSTKQKKGVNKWLHPDVVGVYFPFNDKIKQYEQIIINFQNDFSVTQTKIFSFELKIKIDTTLLREYYFQAVANSSWANEGYLVVIMAVENDVIEEVRRLSNRFGIGLIKLDPENIEQGEILVPARFNKHLDFDAMDRLAAENPDFRIFLQNIIDDNKITNVKSKYDDILDDDEYQQYVKEKKIIN